MNYRMLGRTRLRVSEVGVGCWAFGGVGWGPVDDRDSISAIRRAMELGVNFFDTADSYGAGHSEEILARAIGDAAEAVVCSKAGILPDHGRQDFSATHLVTSVEASLRRLRREVIDLYLLHNPDRTTLQRGEAYDTLDTLQREGKIRSWGVSIRPRASWRSPPSGATDDPVSDANLVLEHGRAAAVEIVFNMLEPEAASMFGRALADGVGVIARVPLASGLLSGKFSLDTQFPRGDFRRRWPREQLAADIAAVERISTILCGQDLAQAALRFALSYAGVSVTIPGARNAQQAEHNARASLMPPFGHDELARILASATSPAAVGH